MIAPTVAWLVLLAAPAAGVAGAPPDVVTLSGEVVMLTDALKARGQAADPEPIARQVVVRGKDRALTPLLCDEGSRAFFQDGRLRDRPAELKVRRLAGLPYVQVLSFRVESEGKLQRPEYFCEVCTIGVRYPQSCPCCQGPMELRMIPELP